MSNKETHQGFKAGVLTVSDKGAKGERVDTAGEYIVQTLRDLKVDVTQYQIVADEILEISRTLEFWADTCGVDFIITTGGTGIAPRDVTPEATMAVIEKQLPGIEEIMRADGYTKTPTAILSRAVAGIRRQCLIINLPGNPKAVQEYLDLLLPVIPHAIDTIHGRIGDHI
jgi:molybdopterin adenylyltransferase